MKRFSRLVAVSALAALGVGAAGPTATLYTPPMPRPSVGEMDCRLVNVGEASLRVTITLFDSNTGQSVASNFCDFLPPGLHCSVGNLPGPALGHCKFEVSGGAKNAVRAAILSEGDEVHAALPAE